MAVLGGISGGSVRLQLHDSSILYNFHNPNVSAFSLRVSNPQSSTTKSSIKMSAISSPSLSSSKVSPRSLPRKEKKNNKQEELLHERIDEWMRDSVVEIVKKLPESPLLVQVYCDGDSNTTKTRTEIKAEEKNWVSLKQKWEKGEAPTPEGVIFVEQIQEEEEEEIEKEKNEDVSRAWGIVVQSKGEEGCGTAPACYLLKTSKVGSRFGLRCTHFCLVKVQSFRETAFSQLKNCWLLQGN